MKQITKYICSQCGEEYRSKIHCERHEAECKAQGIDKLKTYCPTCNSEKVVCLLVHLLNGSSKYKCEECKHVWVMK